MTQNIALVDDDQNFLVSISAALEDEGYKVDTYTDGEKALEGMGRRPVDLAILDIKMPRMDGMELLASLHQKGRVPVIFLTSKDEEIDEEIGLRMGADDYITKPFSQRLLLARIRAVLRRYEPPDTEEEKKILSRGELVVDPGRHLCTWKGMEVNLTVTEFLLVDSLSSRPGHVKSRDQLIDAAYGENINVIDRAVDCHIKRTRKKFKEIDSNFDEIETLYGVGYRWR